ncbi:TerC family protein [Pontibacter akesuensis]|uniref:Tellurite resistance protein TerC n=1 Tax=Pontibacter akesuensis TaxID=388950 RepID=A0A1I7KYC1_9BACT|nr:TerC family protein [Pontibacter akesuensis]GHA80033.1 membrane protein [Pontibacter akesuensis]SFV02469.1 tellurite resistance protein TerC [Pontibacter akesuensis]
MENSLSFWILFNAFVLLMLGLDLFVFHRDAHEVKIKEALLTSLFWIALALGFNVLIYFWQGERPAMEFLTGYLIEKSLSVDNLFVFIMIFNYFKVPLKYQHNLLFWGVLGALVLRAIFILVGVALIAKFHFLIYIMGAFLVFTGIKMAFSHGDEEVHPENNPLIKWVSRHMRITKTPVGGKFFTKIDGKWFATPLFLVLIMIESTDVVFAADSIPAILAISKDPFIVYTSNVFALLGLRALYFALAGIMQLFHYLHYGLSVILVFIGAKLMLSDIFHIDMRYALLAVGGILAISIIASLLFPRKASNLPPPPDVY